MLAAVDDWGVWEGAGELLCDVFADFEGIDANAWADGGADVVGAQRAHRGDCIWNDVGEHAFPTGVNGGDNAACFARHEHGAAVGDANHRDASGVVGDNGVGFGVVAPMMRGLICADDVDIASVDLVDLNNFARGGAHRVEDELDVAGDVVARVAVGAGELAGVAEVEGVELAARDAAEARGIGVGWGVGEGGKSVCREEGGHD